MGFVQRLVSLASLTLVLGCTSKTTKTVSSTEVAPADAVAQKQADNAPRPVIVDAVGRPLSFAPLVDRADPSVCTVKAIEVGREANGRVGPLTEGLGTAFIYDKDGYLLTNHHVIEKATDILVTFKDGKEVKAKVVGADARVDVAVLKVDAKDLPALVLGDSDEPQVGDWVVAIGNPFGLSHTVSAGILSARGRTRDDVKGLDTEGYFDFLQTDASINPGNSGGPLLNLKGEVVGINAAIRQNANGIGFAIPVNMVKDILPMLLHDGHVTRSALGVVVDNLSFDQAGRLGLSDRKGAWVKAVQSGGPADKAGIGVDDVIVAFNGRSTDDPDKLRWAASIGGVGKTVAVRVARGPKFYDIKVTLGELPAENDDH
jgi:serine protease Do